MSSADPIEPSSSSDDDFADKPYYDEDQSRQLSLGQLVRHPKFGLARIVQVVPSRNNSRVVIQLTSGARKTIFLKYVELEPLDFPG